MLQVSVIAENVTLRNAFREMVTLPGQFTCTSTHFNAGDLIHQKDSVYPPDVILVSLQGSFKQNTDILVHLHEHFPTAGIIALVSSEEILNLYQYINAGAIGCLLISSTSAQIKDALITVALGGVPLNPAVLYELLSNNTNYKLPATEFLSPRETEVINAIADGLSYKLVADRLHLSLETVRHHMKNIYRKMHINSKGELIKKMLDTR